MPDLSQLSHSDKDALIVAMHTQILALSAEVQELKRRLALNSRNSGRPPSSDGLAKPGHEGSTLKRVD